MPPGPVIVSSASRCSGLSEPWISLPISRRACLRDASLSGAAFSVARRSAISHRELLQLAQAAGRPHAVLEADQLAAARQLVDQPVGLGGPAGSGGELVGLGAQLAVARSSRARSVTSSSSSARRLTRSWLEIERSSNSCSARSALSPCSSPTALQASLTSSRSAALLEPRVRDRQRAELAGPWLAAVALAEEAGGAVDVFGAR